MLLITGFLWWFMNNGIARCYPNTLVDRLLCVFCVCTLNIRASVCVRHFPLWCTQRGATLKKEKKKKVVLIHLQLGHVPLTFFLLADSQLKSGDTPLFCYWQRAMGVGWSGVGGGGTWADGKHTLPVIITVWWRCPRDRFTVGIPRRKERIFQATL